MLRQSTPPPNQTKTSRALFSRPNRPMHRELNNNKHPRPRLSPHHYRQTKIAANLSHTILLHTSHEQATITYRAHEQTTTIIYRAHSRARHPCTPLQILPSYAISLASNTHLSAAATPASATAPSSCRGGCRIPCGARACCGRVWAGVSRTLVVLRKGECWRRMQVVGLVGGVCCIQLRRAGVEWRKGLRRCRVASGFVRRWTQARMRTEGRCLLGQARLRSSLLERTP